jgi:hypothetical protein
MPAFLENKLKARYGQNSDIPYKVMNKLGAMKGNKETPKGAAMQAQHNKDMAQSLKTAFGAARKRLK